MKAFRYGIVLLAGFCLGWFAQSGMGIAMRKSAGSRLLSESELSLKTGRDQIAAYKSKQKRFPTGASELSAAGYLDPGLPLVESFSKSGRWASEWDGKGGFVYLTQSGELYLNIDVSREKLFRTDWERVLEGNLFPKGKIH